MNVLKLEIKRETEVVKVQMPIERPLKVEEVLNITKSLIGGNDLVDKIKVMVSKPKAIPEETKSTKPTFLDKVISSFDSKSDEPKKLVYIKCPCCEKQSFKKMTEEETTYECYYCGEIISLDSYKAFSRYDCSCGASGRYYTAIRQGDVLEDTHKVPCIKCKSIKHMYLTEELEYTDKKPIFSDWRE